MKRWEQAFQIYATIYTKAHPERAPEMFQYIYNICEAASAYVWDNVYRYDIAFQQVMEKNPARKWNVILQQGWSLFLKDKLERNHTQISFGNYKRKQEKKVKECWRFNKGRCSFGTSCCFGHKCTNCSSTEHGQSTCTAKKDK